MLKSSSTRFRKASHPVQQVPEFRKLKVVIWGGRYPDASEVGTYSLWHWLVNHTLPAGPRPKNNCSYLGRHNVPLVESNVTAELELWLLGDFFTNLDEFQVQVHGAQLVIVVYDITRKETFAVAKKYLEYIRNNVSKNSTVMCLVGNKLDLALCRDAPREISFMDIKMYTEVEGFIYVETSILERPEALDELILRMAEQYCGMVPLIRSPDHFKQLISKPLKDKKDLRVILEYAKELEKNGELKKYASVLKQQTEQIVKHQFIKDPDDVEVLALYVQFLYTYTGCSKEEALNQLRTVFLAVMKQQWGDQVEQLRLTSLVKYTKFLASLPRSPFVYREASYLYQTYKASDFVTKLYAEKTLIPSLLVMHRLLPWGEPLWSELSPNLMLDLSQQYFDLRMIIKVLAKAFNWTVERARRLASVSLSKNRIDNLFEAKLHFLPLKDHLIELDLSHNNIKVVPEWLIEFDKLQVLNISHNRLESFPPCLIGLKKLYLQGNPDLQLIPSDFQKMVGLEQFSIDAKTVTNIPVEIVTRKPEDIRKYLGDLQKGSEKCYRVKLMIVGEEKVGKTSLLKRLQEPENIMERILAGAAAVAPTTISTDGIDIERWSIKLSDTNQRFPGEIIDFAAWDFAGQQIYYSTHQFFLTRRSIFLLVWDITKDPFHSRIEFWLESIWARVKGQPILIVGTHLDDEEAKLNFKNNVDRLKAKYNKFDNALSPDRQEAFRSIEGYMAVSCKTREGMKELVATIVKMATKQPHMGEEIPNNYLALERAVLQLRTKRNDVPVMSWDQMKDMWREHTGMQDEGQLIRGCELLHDMGSVIYFSKGRYPSLNKLSNLVITDPQWLVKVFACVITTKHKFVKNGILRHSDLSLIWNSYPSELHHFLCSLMQQFEMSFALPTLPIQHGKSLNPDEKLRQQFLEGRSLVACLLPDERPRFELLWRPFDANVFGYSRTYKLHFMPAGLFSHFMIRLFRFSRPRVYWANGMVITQIGESKAMSKALIELQQVENVIEIHVRGVHERDASLFFRDIVDLLDSLLTEWFDVVHEVFIAYKPQPSREAYLFNLKECEVGISHGNSVVIWKNGMEAVAVRLDQLAPDLCMKDFDSCLIPKEALEVGQQIAEGGFGVVFKGLWNGQPVAIKQLITGGEAGASAYRDFRKEAWIMSRLSHKNIVQLKGFSMDPFQLVLEFATGGTLLDFITELSNQMTDVLKTQFALDIAEGMAFLHCLSPPLVHRDLKSPNILIFHEERRIVAKVADFGQSLRSHLTGSRRRHLNNNPIWLAPEVLKEGLYTVKSDVYAFGIIMWELRTRKFPFSEDSQFLAALANEIEKGHRPELPDTRGSETYQKWNTLMTSCWSEEPSNRPEFSYVAATLSALLHDVEQEEQDATSTDTEEDKQQEENASLRAQENGFDKTSGEKEKEKEPEAIIAEEEEDDDGDGGSMGWIISKPSGNSSLLSSGRLTGDYKMAPGDIHQAFKDLRFQSARFDAGAGLISRVRASSILERPNEPNFCVWARPQNPDTEKGPGEKEPAITTELSQERVTDGKIIRELDVKKYGVSGIISCALEVDSEVWCGCKDGYLLTLDANNGDKLNHVRIHSDKVYDIVLVGKTIWTLGGESIKIWSVASLADQEGQLGAGDSEQRFVDDELEMRKVGKLKLKGRHLWRMVKVVLNTRIGTFSCTLSTAIGEELSLLNASLSVDPKKNRFVLTVADVPHAQTLERAKETKFRFKAADRDEFSSWVRHIQHAIEMAKYYKEEMELITTVPTAELFCLLFVPSDPVPTVWAAGEGTVLRIWEARQGLPGLDTLLDVGEGLEFEERHRFVRRMVLHVPTDVVWIAVGNSIVRISCTRRERIQVINSVHEDIINCLCLVPSTGDIWTCGGDNLIKVWDERGELKGFVEATEKEYWVNTLCFDGACVWSGDRDGELKMWNVHTMKKVPKFSTGLAKWKKTTDLFRQAPVDEDGNEPLPEMGIPVKHRDKVSCILLTHRRVIWSMAWDREGSNILLWE